MTFHTEPPVLAKSAVSRELSLTSSSRLQGSYWNISFFTKTLHLVSSRAKVCEFYYALVFLWAFFLFLTHWDRENVDDFVYYVLLSFLSCSISPLEKKNTVNCPRTYVIISTVFLMVFRHLLTKKPIIINNGTHNETYILFTVKATTVPWSAYFKTI